MATTFMPAYARAVYDYFRPRVVLDPCGGWGDRLLGCATTPVWKYVGFDPNMNLRPGYARLMGHCGHHVTDMDTHKLRFSNRFEMRSLPFEVRPTVNSQECSDCLYSHDPVT